MKYIKLAVAFLALTSSLGGYAEKEKCDVIRKNGNIFLENCVKSPPKNYSKNRSTSSQRGAKGHSWKNAGDTVFSDTYNAGVKSGAFVGSLIKEAF